MACRLLIKIFFRDFSMVLVINEHKIASHKLGPMVQDSNRQEEDTVLQGQLKDEIYLFEYHIIFCLECKKNLKRRLECHF